MNGGFHQLSLRQSISIKLVSTPSEILLLQPLECGYVATHPERLALLGTENTGCKAGRLS